MRMRVKIILEEKLFGNSLVIFRRYCFGLTCNRHPWVSRYVWYGLPGGRGARLWAGGKRVDDGACRLVVELRCDGHGRGGRADGTCGRGDRRGGGSVLVVVSEGVVDHRVCGRNAAGEAGGVPAALVCGGVDGRRQSGGARGGEGPRHHRAGGGGGVEGRSGHRLLLLVVVVRRGANIRVHPCRRRSGRCRRRGRRARWRRGRVVDCEGCFCAAYRVVEQLLMVELLMILR